MKILLTGATGWIGSHIAVELVRRGHEVHAVARPGSDRRRVRRIEDRLIWHEGEMDLVPTATDAAIHAAWHVNPSDYHTSPENRRCLEASLRLLSRLRCRAVFLGTLFELDTRIGRVDEDCPTRPLTLYSQCKDELRRAVVLRDDSAWVRLFYQYGPFEDRRRTVPSVICALLRGGEARVSAGEQRRDYLHVSDVASAVCDIAESSLQGPVNVGAGEAPRMRDIFEIIGRETGRSDLIRFGAIPYYAEEPMLIVADNRKLRSIGWTPAVPLDRGLTDTVAWWRTALLDQEPVA